MNVVLGSITMIAQLVCLCKAFNSDKIDNIIFYRNMSIAFGICGICITNIPKFIDLSEEFGYLLTESLLI